MKQVYGNSFVTGRELAKKLAIVAVIACAFSLLSGSLMPEVQLAATLFTLIVMVVLIYVIATRCKCPYCGKHITFGVLQIKQCPRCKRSLTTGKKLKK